ncbi:MAG: hypothetical protein GY722_16360 [bacterium]|nr:hypothetical protein [bacterium]
MIPGDRLKVLWWDRSGDRDELLLALLDRAFGYDVFISYARSDGTEYTNALVEHCRAQRLRDAAADSEGGGEAGRGPLVPRPNRYQ